MNVLKFMIYISMQILHSIVDFDREKLDSHSGALQAAIGLEWDSTEATHVDIQYHMINGQLPNLDLVNLANRMIEKVGLSTTIHDEVKSTRCFLFFLKNVLYYECIILNVLYFDL